MKAFPSLGLPRCRPARFLTDLSKALAVPSLGEASGGCFGFLGSGGEAAGAGGQRPAWHLGAATERPEGPRPLRPATSRAGPGGAQRPGTGGHGPCGEPPHVPPRHAPQTDTGRRRRPGRGRARRGSRVRGRSGEAEGGARGGAGAERSRLRVRGRRPGRLRGVVPTLVYYALLGKLTNE